MPRVYERNSKKGLKNGSRKTFKMAVLDGDGSSAYKTVK